jgi:EpsI family protein
MTVLVVAVWPIANWQVERDMSPPLDQLASLGPIIGWQRVPQGQGLPNWQPRFQNYSASTQATFENDGRVAGLFLGYYRNQDQQHKMVTSMNVLVTSDDPVWSKVEWWNERDRDRPEGTQGAHCPVAFAHSSSARLVVWQWYWVNGHWTASDVLAKVYTTVSRLTGSGDDSAVIVLYTHFSIRLARRMPRSRLLRVRQGRRWKPSCARRWKPGDKGVRQAAAGGPCGIQF